MIGAGEAVDTSFFGHPRGLSTLFFTEMWERFSYYGMRALLILFMTASVSRGGLGFDVVKAAAIYGIYTSAVYLGGLPGGWVADHLLGLRRAVITGGVFIVAGQCCLAVSNLATFYAGLVLIVIGTGLLKPNVSAIVGELYAPADNRRDSGFSIYYMGINLGSFLAPLTCGYVGELINWHAGFGLAAAGMTLGLVQFRLGLGRLKDAGARVPDRTMRESTARQMGMGALGLALAACAIYGLVRTGLVGTTAQGLSTAMGLLLVAISAVLFAWLFWRAWGSPSERRRIGIVLLLFVASALFWSIFEQAGSTLNLFAERNTDRGLLGRELPASWFQSLGPLFIISLAPLFAWFWNRLGSRNPSSAAKFAWGLLFAGLGFGVLALAAMRGIAVSPLWLVLTYLLHTAGELCVSPVGLSAMTRLAPRDLAGMMMGVWFLSTALGNYLGGRVASFYEALPLAGLFGVVTLMAFVAAGMMAGAARRIDRPAAP